MSGMEIVYNFESPQTEILGSCTIGPGFKFIMINLTCHNIMFGYDEDILIKSIISTINHEEIHGQMNKVCIHCYQENIVKVIDVFLFPMLIPDWGKYISPKERYKLEDLAGYG